MNKYLPSFLIGCGIGCLVDSVIMAFEFEPLMREAIEEKKEELEVPELTAKEAIQASWMYVVPSVVMAAIGTGLVLGGNQMNLNREAAVMAAYTMADQAYKEYREKTKEIIGERKEQKIRESIEKESLNKNHLNKEILLSDDGNYLCYDAHTDRYFKSNINKLKRAELILDRRLIDEQFVSLNELYIEIGLDTVRNGDYIGWHLSDGYINMSFTPGMTKAEQLCLVMDFENPKPRYSI